MKKRIRALILIAAMVITNLAGVLSFATVAKADGEGPVLKLHYHREDGAYDGWDVWLWEEGHDGGGYPFAEEEGEMVATMNVTPGTMSIGFIVRTQDWTKDVDKDQFIDISEVVSGQVDIYVESGVEGYTKEYGDDVVMGIKLKTAKYDGAGVVEVQMTADIPGEWKDKFTVSGTEGEIAVSDIQLLDGSLYRIILSDELNPYKGYNVTYDGTTYKINMPILYSTEDFENEFTYNGDDLGFTYSSEKTSFRVWAPTAESMTLKRYESGNQAADDLIEEIPMTSDVNGTWVCEVSGDLNGTYYTYAVTIDGKKTSVMDPYARSSGANGKRSMVLDLASTNPEGWDADTNPYHGAINDAIIYEAHVRDLTVGSDNGISNQGKFLGVVEKGTATSSGIPTGLDHILDLGVTHLHILPMYDFGSVDEVNKSNGVYNWGYDPVNYNIPEGSYSTDALHGEVRVKEAKEMVKGLHDNGIAVVMDVVYNHVYNAESFCINQLVPGYFSRISADGVYSSGSGCGNDTATERSMVRKYIVDSVNYWADEYHIDGFRFDLVGLMDVDLINEIVETVHEKHPDVIFYGEGWSMATAVTKENVELATQTNSALTPDFAYFNDTIRDGIKGSVFNSDPGFVSGASGYEPKIVRCFMGADNWCGSPTQTINYASCHDNNTLFDRIRLSVPDITEADAIKMNNLAASIYLLAEGTPFMQAGEEMLRTKTNDDGTYNSNSYASGDKVNAIDWSSLEKEEYAAVFEYYKGLIEFRKYHPILRLTEASEIEKSVKEVTCPETHMVAFDITNDLDGESAEEMYIIYNANNAEEEMTLPEGNWNAYIDGKKAGTTALYSVSGTAKVEPLSALVLIKEDTVVEEPASDDEPSVSEEPIERTDTGETVQKKGVSGLLIGGLAAAAAIVVAGFAFLFKKKKD